LDAAQERLLADAPDARRDPAGADGGLGHSRILVETELLGTARATRRAEDHGVEQLAHEPLVVDAGPSDFCGERNAPSIGQNVGFDANSSRGRPKGRCRATTTSTIGNVRNQAIGPLSGLAFCLRMDDSFPDAGEAWRSAAPGHFHAKGNALRPSPRGHHITIGLAAKRLRAS
jgi:hypothetical protein